VATHAAVGVDDDLAPGETGVGVRATEFEGARGVDPDGVVVVGELLGNDRPDHVLDQVGLDHRITIDTRRVLGRHEHRGEPHRSPGVVVERHLGLAVGAQVGHDVGLAHLGEALGHAMSEPDRDRHQILGLVARVAEHHPLVAGAL
jgi:hypothetical protein